MCVLLASHEIQCILEAFLTNSVDPDQIAPAEAV